MFQDQSLLQSYILGGLKLKNRIVMAPMTRNRANNPGNVPTDLMAVYYAQRSSAGLIITEGSPISKRAVGYINTPGIYSPEQVEGWKKVTRAVHAKTGKIFLQLWHVGRISHPDFHAGELPLAPSALNPTMQLYTPLGLKDTVTPQAMSVVDIKKTIQDFRQGAKNAIEAGFDGVEIHASNGYLLHQFFNRGSNIRTDAYGGSIEKRAKILFEVIDEMKKVISVNAIGIRLNPSLHGLYGMSIDAETIKTFDYIVEELNKYKLA
ncbi:MAG: alkene reductase, partial [Endomicrobiales bacterium]